MSVQVKNIPSYLLLAGVRASQSVFWLEGARQGEGAWTDFALAESKQLSDLSLPSRAWGQIEHFTHLFFQSFLSERKQPLRMLAFPKFFSCFHAYVCVFIYILY